MSFSFFSSESINISDYNLGSFTKTLKVRKKNAH